MSKPGRKFTNGRGEGRDDGYAGSNLTSWTYRDGTPGRTQMPAGKPADGSVYLQDPDVTLYHGDVLQVLRELPAESVDCCVTSPPYWGLRDYGQEGQLGLESTPEEFVAKMVEVFREVRRVLAPHGTVWLNLGDSYASSPPGNTTPRDERPRSDKFHAMGAAASADRMTRKTSTVAPGLKQKDLVGVPWRVAFALQADGWYLRSDIIWAKPNPMPESVTDRPTKAHEYVFLLSKQPRYFFDTEAVREEYAPKTLTHRGGGKAAGKVGNQDSVGKVASGNFGDWDKPRTAHPRPRPQEETLDGSQGEAPRGPDGRRNTHVEAADGSIQHRDGERWPNGGRNIRSVWEIATQPYPEEFDQPTLDPSLPPAEPKKPSIRVKENVSDKSGPVAERPQTERVYDERKGPNVRSVWHIATQPYPEAHFATFPEELARRCIAAGTSERGKCPECGAPWVRELGWKSECKCNGMPGRISISEIVPCVVLDPFMGSGTVAHVARKLGRHAVGIDLNESYLELAARRLQQQSLFAVET